MHVCACVSLCTHECACVQMCVPVCVCVCVCVVTWLTHPILQIPATLMRRPISQLYLTPRMRPASDSRPIADQDLIGLFVHTLARTNQTWHSSTCRLDSPSSLCWYQQRRRRRWWRSRSRHTSGCVQLSASVECFRNGFCWTF